MQDIRSFQIESNKICFGQCSVNPVLQGKVYPIQEFDTTDDTPEPYRGATCFKIPNPFSSEHVSLYSVQSWDLATAAYTFMLGYCDGFYTDVRTGQCTVLIALQNIEAIRLYTYQNWEPIIRIVSTTDWKYGIRIRPGKTKGWLCYKNTEKEAKLNAEKIVKKAQSDTYAPWFNETQKYQYEYDRARYCVNYLTQIDRHSNILVYESKVDADRFADILIGKNSDSNQDCRFWAGTKYEVLPINPTFEAYIDREGIEA